MQTHQPQTMNIMLSDLRLRQALYHLRMCERFVEESMSTATNVGVDEMGNDLTALVIVESRLTQLSRLYKSAVQREASQHIEQ